MTKMMNLEIEDMGADEQCVLHFLNHWPASFISGMEIARRAGGKARFEDDPRWAGLALSQLVELNLVEFDGSGRFRLKGCPTVKCGGKQRFIAPHLREILQRNGLKFGQAA